MEPYDIMYVKNTRFSRLCSRRIYRLISRNYDASPYLVLQCITSLIGLACQKTPIKGPNSSEIQN